MKTKTDLNGNNKDSGFILLEMLGGFFIFIFLLSVFSALISFTNQNLIRSQKKFEQIENAHQQIEQLKNTPWTALSSNPQWGLTVNEIKPGLKEAVLSTLNEEWVFYRTR